MSWDGPDTVVDNDLWALLRAGTESPDAVAVVCGTGINAVGVRADGATARFAALGPISGDWGGGSGLGEEALWHAARAEDGRGPETAAARRSCSRAWGSARSPSSPSSCTSARASLTELAVLAPGVFEAARRGDAIAGTIVDRQADEVVAFARASLTRLELLDREVPVVLGGGVIRAGDERLMTRIAERLAADAPQAHVVLVDRAPDRRRRPARARVRRRHPRRPRPRPHGARRDEAPRDRRGAAARVSPAAPRARRSTPHPAWISTPRRCARSRSSW